MLSEDRVLELLQYDPETGDFTWRVDRVSGQGKVQASAGEIAGSFDRLGYCCIGIDRRIYKAHRLAFVFMTGTFPQTRCVDHVNGDPGDNRWCNLREATHSQNQGNMRRRSDNTSGYKGVTRGSNNWRAQICVGSTRRYLGSFSTPEEAHEAYKKAAGAMFGDFARTT